MKGLSLVRFSILAVAALILIPFCSAQAKLGGDWQGTYVDANGTTFHLVWHVTAAPDGALTSTFDNVDESIFGIKARTTTVKGSDVKIEVDDVIQIPTGQDTKSQRLVSMAPLMQDGKRSDRHLDADRIRPGSTDSQMCSSSILHPGSRSRTDAAAPAAIQPAITGDWSGTLP